MRLIISAIGLLKKGPESDLVADYLKRLRGPAKQIGIFTQLSEPQREWPIYIGNRSLFIKVLRPPPRENESKRCSFRGSVNLYLWGILSDKYNDFTVK